MQIRLTTLDEIEAALFQSNQPIRLQILAALAADPGTARKYVATNGRGLTDILVKALDMGDLKFRRAALRTVEILADDRTVDLLLLRLADPNQDLRNEIAAAIGRLSSPDDQSPLIPYLYDPDYGVAQTAALALERADGLPLEVEVRKRLCGITNDDWDPVLAPGPRAMAVLWEILGESPGIMGRKAEKALGRFGPEHWPAVSPIFRSGSGGQKIAFLKIVGEKTSHLGLDFILFGMDDPEDEVVLQALKAVPGLSFSAVDPEKRLAIGRKALASIPHRDPEIRAAAYKALSWSDHPETIAVLRRGLTREAHPLVLAEIIRDYGKREPPDFSAITPFLNHSDWRVRGVAARTAAAGGPEARAYLEKLAGNETAPAPARISAFQAVGDSRPDD